MKVKLGDLIRWLKRKANNKTQYNRYYTLHKANVVYSNQYHPMAQEPLEGQGP